MPRVVANTTPLIAFAKVDRLDILHRLYGVLLIPEAVLSEVKYEPARTRVCEASWIRVVPIKDVERRRMFSARLHAGEVDVMILAQEEGADLVLMDDNAAKKTAKIMGFSVTGTFGVLLRAKREGIIDSVSELADAIIADGFYASEGLRRLVLKMAGEL